MREHEFWRERATGEVWAIEFRDGAVSGCCGPLDPGELEETFLPALDYSPARVAWIETHREEFDLCDVTRL